MFREKIKEALEQQGWSILRLSKETGIRNASLTEYIRGNKDLFSENVEKCLEVLNIQLGGRSHYQGNRSYFENLQPEDLTEQTALLVLALAYKRQERQTCMLDIRPFEYRNGKKLMVKIPNLIMAIYPDNLRGELQKAALQLLQGKKTLEIGEEGSTEFVQGLLFREE